MVITGIKTNSGHSIGLINIQRVTYSVTAVSERLRRTGRDAPLMSKSIKQESPKYFPWQQKVLE